MELLLAGFVALLTAIFGSPEAVLNNNPVRWVRESLGIGFGDDPRLPALLALCGIFLLIICKNILNIAQQRHMAAFSENVSSAVKIHLFRFFQRAPFLWITRNGAAELLFVLGAAQHLADGLLAFLQAAVNILTLLALLAGLVTVSPVPSLISFVILGLFGRLVVKAAYVLLDRNSNAMYTANYHTSKLTHLALHGLKEIRFSGRENALFSMYVEQLSKFSKASSRLKALLRLPAACLETLGFGTLVVVMLYLIFIQDAGMARISGIMGFMAAAAWRGLPVANRLLDSLSHMRPRLPYLNRVTELIILEHVLSAELLPLDTLCEPLRFERNVTLENISFRYPEAATETVSEVSLTIEVGQMIGLVGLSGAGKSTLVNLLTGLIPPESGRVLVDDVPLTKANVSAWLAQIGYVSQAPYILDASMAENVGLSRFGEGIDREKVLECCRMAAIDFLDELEDGIDTILGDRGVRLSGGQSQRVAIARALYSNPSLIIFDEATSSLDMKNEKVIYETILSLRGKITLVVVAHRLTTVEGCDSVVWIDKGTIRQTGSAQNVLEAYREALDAEALCSESCENNDLIPTKRQPNEK
jgi:ABC-type bacteriocin/lantibiotic exporter with double-glycine peptidase domain